MYTVFYLLGGTSNFICNSMIGKFNLSTAKKHVTDLKKMGYKARLFKTQCGYSFNQFANSELALKYYNNF